MVKKILGARSDLRRKRQAAGLPGYLVARAARIGRSRFSDIERNKVAPTDDEMQAVEHAIQKLVDAREKVATVAAEVGWPVSAL